MILFKNGPLNYQFEAKFMGSAIFDLFSHCEALGTYFSVIKVEPKLYNKPKSLSGITVIKD